jgi:hypothetical protein
MKMKKNYKLIYFLKSVNNFQKISKYSETLEKLFKKRGIKSLINSLNKERIYTEIDVFDLKFNKTQTENFHPSNYYKNHKCLLDYNYEDYLERLKEIESKKKKKIEPWSINEKTPRFPKPKEAFDSYRYTPNYDMRFKKVPSFSFVKSAKSGNLEDCKVNLNNKMSLKKKGSVMSLTSKNLSSFSNMKNLSDSNIENGFFKTEANIKVKKKKYPLLYSFNYNYNLMKNNLKKSKTKSSYNKNNHCFKFSNYSSRKPLTVKMLNDRLSYVGPYDYSKTAKSLVNYDKMISRNNNKNPLLSYDSKTPLMFDYSPKYNYIEPDPKKICFEPKSFKKTRKFQKGKIMRRVMTSYNLTEDYLSVDNSKLGKSENYSKFINI